MAFALGGIDGIAITDGSTSVVATDVHEDFTQSEDKVEVGMADGQNVMAGVDETAEFFLLSLSSSDADQLDTWDNDDTTVTATINGLDAVVHWAEPSYLTALRVRGAAGELSGIRIRLSTHA